MPPGVRESLLGYHSCDMKVLTSARDPGGGQCQVDSLTGAVASKKVTEAFKGWFSTDGNRTSSANAKTSLTARPTSRAVTKVGVSDPAV